MRRKLARARGMPNLSEEAGLGLKKRENRAQREGKRNRREGERVGRVERKCWAWATSWEEDEGSV